VSKNLHPASSKSLFILILAFASLSFDMIQHIYENGIFQRYKEKPKMGIGFLWLIFCSL
jgi:hypothetical protein